VETPLSRYFYKAFRESSLTLNAVARRAKVSTATVGHYIHGLRGNSGQRRTIQTIRAIATALGADPDRAVELSTAQDADPVAQRILADRGLSKRDKDTMLAMLAMLSSLRGK
jgi:transcriptional regulator with XRE-family HTH domain